MKIVFRLVFLVAVPVGAQSSVVFSWSHNPLNNGIWPVCSTSVKKMCQIGYTLTDVTTASAPVLISSTIAANALTYKLTPGRRPVHISTTWLSTLKDEMARRFILHRPLLQ